jgi:isocitrate dehydrogenase (NAD+)
MRHTITLLPGDGIGPEVTDAAVAVVEAAEVDIVWEPRLAGLRAVEAGQSTLLVRRAPSTHM